MTIKHVVIPFFAVVLMVQLGSVPAFAQSRTPRTTEEESVNSQITHWTGLLNGLVLEAKTLQDEAVRPEAVAAVADAFWELDKKKSTGLFNTAFELAFSLRTEKQRDFSLRRVIVAAAKRDITLAKELVSQLLSRQDSGEHKQPLAAAMDLVDTEMDAAEAVAIANARNGPSYETAELLFKLNAQNANGATRVFSAYLANVRREDPSQLLWIAGFPFGFNEAWGGSVDPSKLSGVFASGDSSLNPNPPLARAFLSSAVQTVDRILEDASALSPPQAENYRALAFFILTYQAQNVEIYRPDLTSRWLTLLQNVGSTLEPTRRDAISNQVAGITAARQRRSSREDSQKLYDDESFESVEKLEGVCHRDQAYTNMALQISYQKDFKRALNVADKVYNLETRSNVIQFIYFDKAIFTLSPKSSGDLDEALAYAQRVNQPDQRGFLYLKFAEFAAKKEPDRARLMLNDILKLSDQIEDRRFRAALLLASAYDLAMLDSSFLEVYTTLEKAIHLFSDDNDVDVDQIRLQRSVRQKCADTASWSVSGEDLGQYNLSDTLVRISEKDSQTAEELASELPVGLNRTKNLASIASARLKALKTPPKTRASRP